MKNRAILFISLALVFIMTVNYSGCSDKSVNNEQAVSKAQLAIDVMDRAVFSQGIADNFQLIIYRDLISEDTLPVDTLLSDTLIDTSLVIIGDTIRTQINNLPVNELLVFEARVSISETNVAIYEGQTTVALNPDEVTTVNLDLVPVVSMLRLSPKNIQAPPGTSFDLALKVLNVSSLYGITARVTFDSSLIRYDSTKLFTEVDTVSTLPPLAILSGDTLALGLTLNVPGESLTDAGGDATIFTISFTTLTDVDQALSSVISVFPTEMTLTDSTNVRLLDIYTVDCEVEF